MVHAGVTFPIPSRYEYVGPRLDGGQGYVYLYRDTFLQRHVAIKEMKHPGDAGVLRDELAKIREIRSRHVVEVYDLFEAKRSGGVALVEEYVPGSTLENLAAFQPALSDIQAIRILWQIACGLSDIHAHHIIHRDVKPRNIKRDTEGVIKILDFGLSSNMAPEAETVASRGTAHYLAPEMYDTPPIRLSWEIDVYAFGVTAWHLLNGGILPAPLREVPPNLKNVNVSLQGAKVILPTHLTDMLDKTINRNPKQRPTMESIRDEFYRQITSGQHRLTFTYEGKHHLLSKVTPRATLKAGTSSLTINYDQFKYFVEIVEGEVYFNNAKVEVGMALPDSCVITFGDHTQGQGRTFVPMTVLVPEVVL